MRTWSLMVALALMTPLATHAQGIKIGIDGEGWRKLDEAGPLAKSLKVMFVKGVYEGIFFGASSTKDAYSTNPTAETLVDALDAFYSEPANRGILVIWALQVVNLQIAGKSEEEVGRATRYNRCRSSALASSSVVDEVRSRLADCDPSGLSVDPALDQVFMESLVEERPEIISGPQLQYPDLLRHAGVQGRVLVQVIIDTTGRAEPSSVKIIQSPNPGFDQAAKNYVLSALFRPARVHGRAVRVLLSLPIDFNIKR